MPAPQNGRGRGHGCPRPGTGTAGTGTGVQFAPVTQPALEQAILRTCDLYADRKLWAALTRRAMRQPVGWEDSAAQYMTLYQDILSAGAEASA